MIWHRELHPTKEGKRLYRFATVGIGSLPLFNRTKKHRNCILKHRGIERARIFNGRLFWTHDYAWNGCSPKYYIGWPPIGKWIGTPDPPKSRRKSLGHDILFQFGRLLDITFEEANYHFLLWGEMDGFELAQTYYDAVSCFGLSYWNAHVPDITIEYIPA